MRPRLSRLRVRAHQLGYSVVNADLLENIPCHDGCYPCQYFDRVLVTAAKGSAFRALVLEARIEHIGRVANGGTL